MYTTRCPKHSLTPTTPPPHLTLYGQPPQSKRRRLSHPTCPSGSFAGRLPGQLLETTQHLQKMLDVIDRASPGQLKSLPPETGKDLQQLSVRLSVTAKRLCPTRVTPPTHVPLRVTRAGRERGFKATSEGVVDGVGVVAQRCFRRGEGIAQFGGPIVFRVKNPNGRYNVFSVITTDPVPRVKFHEGDTYIVWSDIYLLHSGNPGIEIGRDGDSNIRYLNHSKNANVQVVSTHTGRMNIHDCHHKLLLNVKALKNIKPGDELVFDYDKTRPDSSIDFTLSTVQLPDDDKADKIQALIIKILHASNPSLPPLLTDRGKCLNQEVGISHDVNVFIDEVMSICEKIQTETHDCPATPDRLLARLSRDQKTLLGMIVSEDETDLRRIKSLAHHVAKAKARAEARAKAEAKAKAEAVAEAEAEAEAEAAATEAEAAEAQAEAAATEAEAAEAEAAAEEAAAEEEEAEAAAEVAEAEEVTEADASGNGITDQLTLKGLQQLRKYLQTSYFNNKQTWIKVEQLRERLHRKKV